VLSEPEHRAAGDHDEVVDADGAGLVPGAGQRFLNAPLLGSSIVRLNLFWRNLLLFIAFLGMVVQ